ncbi:hypothetical protein BDZ89DRAFT_515794 [Hymenopellis radicata]|nr:hypothetical protein BDZ89DRAFT_515794 [Hymenopellis radicata]
MLLYSGTRYILPIPTSPEHANGSLVALWAKRAGVAVIVELPPTPWTGHWRVWQKELRRGPSRASQGRPSAAEGSAPTREGGAPASRERVPAPTKVIRVMARGEKLD